LPEIETRDGAATVAGATASGFAVRYNAWTTIAGAFRERIAPGAFRKSLSDDILALWHHDYARVLGRTSAGTLRLDDRSDGLWFDLDLDARTPDGLTAAATVDRGDVRGCSFGFAVTEESWSDPGAGLPERTIEEAVLFEVTLTAIPAYEQTTVALDRATNSVNARRRRAEAAMRRRGIPIWRT
jgi:HK97 family phage prohead protease